MLTAMDMPADSQRKLTGATNSLARSGALFNGQFGLNRDYSIRGVGLVVAKQEKLNRNKVNSIEGNFSLSLNKKPFEHSIIAV